MKPGQGAKVYLVGLELALDQEALPSLEDQSIDLFQRCIGPPARHLKGVMPGRAAEAERLQNPALENVSGLAGRQYLVAELAYGVHPRRLRSQVRPDFAEVFQVLRLPVPKPRRGG